MKPLHLRKFVTTSLLCSSVLFGSTALFGSVAHAQDSASAATSDSANVELSSDEAASGSAPNQSTPTQSAAASLNPRLSITDPKTRSTDNSAYTLAPGQAEGRLTMFGLGSSELIGQLGLAYAFKHNVELSTNLLHIGAGMLNLGVKWNFFEKHGVALAAEFDPTWINGRWVWVVSDVTATALANMDVIQLPLTLWGSIQPVPWFQFDLGANYTHSFVFGSVDSAFLTADAQLAVRQFRLHPMLRFHIVERLSLGIGARLPVWTTIPGGASAEVRLIDGVVAGGTTGGQISVPFKRGYAVSVQARSLITNHFFATFGLNYGAMPERVYGSALYPNFGVEGRF